MPTDSTAGPRVFGRALVIPRPKWPCDDEMRGGRWDGWDYARHTTTNRDPGGGIDITTTWKLTTSQQNNNNNKACPVGTRGEVANLWRESVQAQVSISIFLPSCPGSAESSR